MDSEYRFKLFIAGINPGSIRAVEIIRDICDSYLDGNYDLEVIDIYQQRQLIKDWDILAVPVLIRVSPEPERRISGDMRDREVIIDALEINGK